jgi:hypothetical protein
MSDLLEFYLNRIHDCFELLCLGSIGSIVPMTANDDICRANETYVCLLIDSFSVDRRESISRTWKESSVRILVRDKVFLECSLRNEQANEHSKWILDQRSNTLISTKLTHRIGQDVDTLGG